jgi:hypothetical protein
MDDEERKRKTKRREEEELKYLCLVAPGHALGGRRL